MSQLRVICLLFRYYDMDLNILSPAVAPKSSPCVSLINDISTDQSCIN